MRDGSASPTPCVLLLQNDPEETRIIKAALTRGGVNVAGPFGSVTPVNEYIKGDQPDLAILDTALADGAAFDVARELQTRGIPFVFYADWNDLDGVPREFREAAFAEKPTNPTLLTKIVGQIIERRAAMKRQRRKWAGGDSTTFGPALRSIERWA